eukprot:2870812-Rhodomonas_salina.1
MHTERERERRERTRERETRGGQGGLGDTRWMDGEILLCSERGGGWGGGRGPEQEPGATRARSPSTRLAQHSPSPPPSPPRP